MMKRYPFISRLLLFVVLPAILAAGALYATLAGSLPQRDGELRLDRTIEVSVTNTTEK